jgi:hypothetical protein
MTQFAFLETELPDGFALPQKRILLKQYFEQLQKDF